MNLQYLRYVVEVEKSGSISKAAEKLYMNQPNLSKAIREVEAAVGVTLFNRTTKGISSTTDAGCVFIEYAKSILSKYDDMQSYFQSYGIKKKALQIAIPRASYISEAFTLFVESLPGKEAFNVSMLETDSMKAIASVADDGYDFGVIRYRNDYEGLFDSLLKERELAGKELLSADAVIIFSRKSVLAGKEVIEAEDLRGMIEVVNDDFSAPRRFFDKKAQKPAQGNERQICVYERGSQFDLLSRIPQTYMWVSPMPRDVLTRNSLIQKEYAGQEGSGFKDVLIFRKKHTFEWMEGLILEKIELVKKEILSY